VQDDEGTAGNLLKRGGPAANNLGLQSPERQKKNSKRREGKCAQKKNQGQREASWGNSKSWRDAISGEKMPNEGNGKKKV